MALEGDPVDFHLWSWETEATFSVAIPGGKCVFRSGGVPYTAGGCQFKPRTEGTCQGGGKSVRVSTRRIKAAERDGIPQRGRAGRQGKRLRKQC